MTTARTGSRVLVGLTATSVLLAACGGGGRAGGGGGGGDKVTLRLSHQWPAPAGDKGDFRAVLAQKFSDCVKEKTGGSADVKIFPNNTLSKATEQYDAMQTGAIDMSVFPLDYASGRVPQFGVTLMPTLPRSHEEAQKWQDAEIGKRVTEVAEKNGVRILTWIWNAGAVGAKGEPVVAPEDVRKGMKLRAAGALVEEMLQKAGAGISSLPSSEIYSAMQTGVLDGAVTSTSSFSSFRLQEQVDSFTSPTKNYTFWFMFQPLIVSMKAWEKLNPEQQRAFTECGKAQQEFAYSASEEDDIRVEKEFQEAGVKVVPMDEAAFAKWQELAKPVMEKFATDVEGGKELLELAQKTSQG